MHEPPVRVPCAVCLEMIESWYGIYAQPCQHSLDDIWMVWRAAVAGMSVDTHKFDTLCPYCGRSNECHSGPGPGPGVGDVSICWGCGKPGIYDIEAGDGLYIREPTVEELIEIEDDQEYWEAKAHRAMGLSPLQSARKTYDD